MNKLRWQLGRLIRLGWRYFSITLAMGLIFSIALSLLNHSNTINSRLTLGLSLFEAYYNHSHSELSQLAQSVPWGICNATSERELKRAAKHSHYFDYLATMSDEQGFCRDQDLIIAPSTAFDVVATGAGPIWMKNNSHHLQSYQLMAIRLEGNRYLFGISKSRRLMKLLFPEEQFLSYSLITLNYKQETIITLGSSIRTGWSQQYHKGRGDLEINLYVHPKHLLMAMKQNLAIGVPVSLFVALAITLLLLYWRSYRGLHPEDLLDTFSNREIYPVFQPIVDGRDKRVLGHELLARWQHPQLGAIPPDEFIPLLEFHHQLDRLLYELAPQCQYLPDQHGYLSINLAGQQLLTENRDLGDFLEHLSRQIGIEPWQMVVEITEREVLDFQSAHFQKTLYDIRQRGFKVAIDDFGTGHNGLASLKVFQPDFLKVDKSFVQMVHHQSDTQPVLDSILQLAHRLNITLIAEGVETEAQRQYLLARGVIRMQGYLFARPGPLDNSQAKEQQNRLRPSRPQPDSTILAGDLATRQT
ncbi:EAL domain, c-di-GMP-specific phosphodiesterase class I (or its enzymatically inactive variant) [Ferrimonas sediminum]|uniref:EAL domain, c-di-GMP-specific phosphodiesterase class I (Or its enzymatically inactive variant) n=1 Tax=Ferrimonas sediminum TaxID=718193 RepID=A0A1G8P112_9GAMM|nr:EAL domain-containing protein [Ferrimonas sediminum]SDI85906.1 EAL domain, c-di-GMP-specific phosphodiesterase class I (or its enzymatically inactive variant) [Ferrimonas sediminum]